MDLNSVKQMQNKPVCLAFQSLLLEFKFKEEMEAPKIGRKISMINILMLNLTKRSR